MSTFITQKLEEFENWIMELDEVEMLESRQEIKSFLSKSLEEAYTKGAKDYSDKMREKIEGVLSKVVETRQVWQVKQLLIKEDLLTSLETKDKEV